MWSCLIFIKLYASGWNLDVLIWGTIKYGNPRFEKLTQALSLMRKLHLSIHSFIKEKRERKMQYPSRLLRNFVNSNSRKLENIFFLFSSTISCLQLTQMNMIVRKLEVLGLNLMYLSRSLRSAWPGHALFAWGTKVYVQNQSGPSNGILHRFCLTRGSTLTSQDYDPSSVVYVSEPIRAIWWYLLCIRILCLALLFFISI